MVPLSPTSDGRVWDIQLVTIAMVLSTAPIFNMGTLILTCTHAQTPRARTETPAGPHTQSKTLAAFTLKKTKHADATGKNEDMLKSLQLHNPKSVFCEENLPPPTTGRDRPAADVCAPAPPQVREQILEHKPLQMSPREV